MLSDILKTYKLNTDFNHLGFYESKEIIQVTNNLKEYIRLGHFVALTGPIGAGKTTLLRKVKTELQKTKSYIVSECQTIEKERVNLSSIVQAIYLDFNEKIEKDRESRDRKLLQLIEKSSRRVVFFIDDAHNLHYKTLTALKILVERGLSLVLIGHPKLHFTLSRGIMEEIGLRCERMEMQGLVGEVELYLEWVIAQAGGQSTIFSPEAKEEIALLCRTPLQVKRIAWEAIKQAYEEGEKQVSRETILNVIAPDFKDLRTELKRLGYTARELSSDYGFSLKQVNHFLDGKLPSDDPDSKQIATFLKTVGIRF